MRFYAENVSVSEDGEHFQLCVEAASSLTDGIEKSPPDSPYLILQRGFEMPDRGLCYIETHDPDYCGHFRLRLNQFSPARDAGSPGTLVHYRTGQPARFWDGVGGKLFLTTQRLIFVTHRGQPWCYTLSLSLAEIANADTYQLFNSIPGGMRVTTSEGRKELFTFGAIRELEADRWAAAILLARYRAYPQWGTEERTE
jgi:hypothetical protein